MSAALILERAHKMNKWREKITKHFSNDWWGIDIFQIEHTHTPYTQSFIWIKCWINCVKTGIASPTITTTMPSTTAHYLCSSAPSARRLTKEAQIDKDDIWWTNVDQIRIRKKVICRQVGRDATFVQEPGTETPSSQNTPWLFSTFQWHILGGIYNLKVNNNMLRSAALWNTFIEHFVCRVLLCCHWK